MTQFGCISFNNTEAALSNKIKFKSVNLKQAYFNQIYQLDVVDDYVYAACGEKGIAIYQIDMEADYELNFIKNLKINN